MAPFCIFIPISISADRLISMPTLQMKGFEAKSARAAEGGAGLCWGGGGGVEGGGRVAAFVGGGVGAGGGGCGRRGGRILLLLFGGEMG